MADNTKIETQSITERLSKSRIVFNWIRRYAAIEIAILLALAIAAYFLGRHLFDASVPGEGDVRSHIFKIQLLQNYLSHFSWPQWNPFWYHGIPEDQFYPPGFYFLGAIFSFIFRNAVVAYKIWLLLAMVLNGIAIYFFARRFLKFDSHLAIWCLLIYETSTPLLINFMYGEGPNLLGWSATIGFLTIYLSQIMDNKINKLMYFILPGTLLGVAILIHPFPVIFAAMVIVIFHLIWLIHNRRLWHTFIRFHIPYIVGVTVIGAIIGMYYWLPALLTLSESSPIYSFTKFMWPGGTIFLLSIIFLALAVTAICRYKIRGDVKYDTLIVSFCLSCALGFGATAYLPFGLGSLVQEFRFSGIIIPFLGILLCLFPLKYRLFKFSSGRVVTALVIGVFLTAFVFALNQREAFAAGYSNIKNMEFSSLYQLLSTQFAANFPTFAVTMLPYFVIILFLALSLRRKVFTAGASHPAYILAGGVCLLLLTSFIPYIKTDNQVNLSRLFKYVDNYEKADYAQLMQSVRDGRLVVPMARGYLTEGDNPVTFGQQWGVETVNGPYNQGDPKFFKITAHLEWSERWLNYDWTRKNLMQESAAKYIFIRDSFALPNNPVGMTTIASNIYGKILSLNETVSHATQVTPILLDTEKTREVTEFFNILMPEGYRMVMIDVKDINPVLINKFNYVMVDSESKIANYPGKKVFILKDSNSIGVSEVQGTVRLIMPYLTYTNQIFYHGDEANGYMWLGWDNWPGAQISNDMKKNLDNAHKLLQPYFNNLTYSPIDYKLTETRINLGNSPGFVLVKDSYFQYWKSKSGDIMPTSQGFMLVSTNSENTVLNFQKPLYYILAAAFSVIGLIAAIVALLTLVLNRRREKPKI